MPSFTYKSFSWAVGTTSFRTTELNLRIEQQLALLDEFWSLPGRIDELWEANSTVQKDYYRHMLDTGFIVGEAARPEKDARQKTSGLVDVGLITNERRLTEAGKALLKISKSGNFESNNLLNISSDSFLYLKQLLKASVAGDGFCVRPFVVTLYALSRLEFLSDDEFTYLLPLCTTAENTETIINEILSLRKGNNTIDTIIVSRLMSMSNYSAALEYLHSEDKITEDVITNIGMNRKSRSYDKPYYRFYMLLENIVIQRDSHSVLPLFEQCGKLSGKPKSLWRQYLFGTTSRSAVMRKGLDALKSKELLNLANVRDFKNAFFRLMHLFKARANLTEYADLNRRYFKTTDTVIFDDSKVILDILPKCWLSSITEELPKIAFSKCKHLTRDVSLKEISAFLDINEEQIYSQLQKDYNITVTNAVDAIRIIKDERYKRFNALIDEKFSISTLVELFKKFENRQDDDIRQIVTNNALIPTIFEYILGVAWYQISGRKGDILNYMNLSLEADLLPRSHATGGNADITYMYEKTLNYPKHCLLIEATLADSTNQRRMEMEPVSRHLGEYILKSKDKNAYALFISTFLHRNVISDFRNRKTYQYYSDNYEKCVDGLKILPLATAEIRSILENGIMYEQLFEIFSNAHNSNEPVPTWYEKEVVNEIV